MKVVGIVAEYNPFHNGHKALNDFAADNGYTHCVSVMSGNFVQRGMPAITEKRVRAEAALKNGSDLILELPVSYSVATAGYFAFGAVNILKSTGAVDALLFGSEHGETVGLEAIARVTETDEFAQGLPKYLETGITFASARSKVIGDILGNEYAEIAQAPNNLLAVEYLRARNQMNWAVEALTFARKGVLHDSGITSDEFASASYLRQGADNIESIKSFVPQTAYDTYLNAYARGLFPSDFRKLEIAVLSHLRRLSIEELSELPDISEGIENRLYNAIREATTIDELYEKIKTKRYTMARVRRLILSAFLDLKQSDIDTPPSYIRVLGCNEKGTEILSLMKRKALLPFGHSLKTLMGENENAFRAAKIEALSTDIYTLSLPKTQSAGYDFYTPGVFLD